MLVNDPSTFLTCGLSRIGDEQYRCVVDFWPLYHDYKQKGISLMYKTDISWCRPLCGLVVSQQLCSDTNILWKQPSNANSLCWSDLIKSKMIICSTYSMDPKNKKPFWSFCASQNDRGKVLESIPARWIKCKSDTLVHRGSVTQVGHGARGIA